MDELSTIIFLIVIVIIFIVYAINIKIRSALFFDQTF